MYGLAHELNIRLSILRAVSGAILWKKFRPIPKSTSGLVQGVRENALAAGTWEVTAVDSLKPQKPLGGQPKGGESSREG